MLRSKRGNRLCESNVGYDLHIPRDRAVYDMCAMVVTRLVLVRIEQHEIYFTIVYSFISDEPVASYENCLFPRYAANENNWIVVGMITNEVFKSWPYFHHQSLTFRGIDPFKYPVDFPGIITVPQTEDFSVLPRGAHAAFLVYHDS
jgi:hypothetical protein